MTNIEMLNNLLTKSGWIVTDKVDETGSVICEAAETANN